ncbi:MAG: MerR family transcriptional regulator [Planctomycetes bacterium]|nr:MerR family transcriptional regulator [Planctomycetota bacterium]
MDNKYTIGQLAGAASVPTSTIRFYERRRLLRPDDRTLSNYRIYGEDTLNRLRFIRAAQTNGFSLEEVSILLAFRDGKSSRCREVQELIKERLADLEKRIGQLRQLKAVLQASFRACEEFEQTGRCRVIELLDFASTSPLAKSAQPPGKKN